MKLGLAAYVATSLVSILIITRQTNVAAQSYEEVLEKGKEHRREEMKEPSGAVNNGGAIGWRRKRHVKGKEPTTMQVHCSLTLSLLRVPKIKSQDESQISFVKY